MRNLKLIIYSCLLLIISESCKQDTKSTAPAKIVQSLKKDTVIPSSSVVINVISDDPKVLNYLNFINTSYLRGENHQAFEEEKIGETTRVILHNMNQPQIMEFFGFGDSANYNTRFLVSPNDTILMTIKEGKISFSGKRADDYNFFYSLDPESNQWSKNAYTNATDYKKSAHSLYLERKRYYDEYIKNHQVSEDFKNHVEAELRFEYLYNLIAPRTDESPLEGIYINSSESIYSVYNQKEVKDELLMDPKSYFGEVTIDDFMRPELINNDYFKRSLIQYIRQYFTGHEYLNYSLQNFEKETEYIEANLTGALREFAIAKTVTDYHKNGFGRSDISMKALNAMIAKYKDEMTNSTYVEALANIQTKLKNFKTALSPIVLEEKLVSIEGDTLSLQHVLAANQNKVKAIDFWASWCKPCIEEIQKVKKFKQGLSNTNDVNWIYISIDHDVKSWRSMSKKLQEFGLMENQYLIINRKKSDILKSFEINMIPRYVILNKANKVISENAPKPSDTLVFRKIIQHSAY